MSRVPAMLRDLRARHVALASALVCFLMLLAPAASAQQWFGEAAELRVEDEDNPLAPGLIATFRGADGRDHVRLVEGLSQVWNDQAPDARLQPGPFQATFTGRLWIQAPGVYKFRMFVAGSVKLSINDTQLVDERLAEPSWIAAEPIELPFGFHPITVEYERNSEAGRLGLYWQGPNFPFEPVASRWLLHEREHAPSADFEHGELLVRGLRCAACHELPVNQDPLAAASLTSLKGSMSRAWLIEWLSADSRNEESAGRRMPHFAFSPDEAAAAADALLAASEPLAEPKALPVKPTPPAKKDKKKKDEPAPPPPSVERGAILFRSIGCLACHEVGNLGTGGLFGGGDLSHVAAKRPAKFFEAWLADPARLNRDHRMPVFPLTPDQRTSLSLYLQTLGTPATVDSADQPVAGIDGMKLIRAAGCANCHALPESLAADAKLVRTKLSAVALARENGTCLTEPDADAHRPGFRLSDDYRSAIRAYLTKVRPQDKPAAPTGHDLLVEHNCLACHARGASPGLATKLPAIAEVDPTLAEVLPALQPPALHGIGDKLTDEALAASLGAPDPPRRAWLRVRMPRFNLTNDQRTQVVAEFIATDRIPPRPDLQLAAFDASLATPALDAAGPRLVTADGFGCTSCHAIGNWEPQKVALNAHGTALSSIGARVRREWFDRWVRNPARIVPQMEMPSVQQPVRGVLDEKLDEQLAAVWRVLNRQDFTPPNPSALRVVRRANLPVKPEPAAVMTDVIEVGGKGFIKPLVIGLDNRHNVLVDLATARLAAWWVGDVGRQQTRGKTWFWEAGMPQLLPVENDDEAPSDLALIAGGKPVHAVLDRQFVTEFDSLDHTPRGLKVRYRLRYPKHEQELLIGVTEQFEPLTANETGRAGFQRTLTIERAPAGSEWELLVLAENSKVAAAGIAASLDSPRGRVDVTLAGDQPSNILAATVRGAIARLTADEDGRCTLSLVYRSEAQPDQFPPLPVVDRTLPKQELDVVPGYEAVRLPITDEVMPTGMAWGRDGTLYVSSLEGRIWRGHDTDSDSLVDKLEPFADDLAAPYGIQVVEDVPRGVAVDVINKYALLRLYDKDGDGRAERTETIASDWGHTRDYHDWAVGLERDMAGNYLIALPCEQDDRSEAAAYLRGRALKLIPRETTPDDPRQFGIEEFCAGLRFPQGLHLTLAGELFATDNQGNYNPFNELNHLEQGKRYGFINSLEAKRGLKPPAQSAAIEIPHPWTRSVNGLSGAPQPYANDLIGCEYDTRRLVRMSLERIAGAFQGAVYPFSREPLSGGPTFEGPLCCGTGPDNAYYIGNIRDSGWGAGSNTGSIVRLEFRERVCGIERVELLEDGFRIKFTQPIDPSAAADPASYSIVSFRRVSTPAYGGDDQDRRAEKIANVDVQPDNRTVLLTLDELREGFVYEFHLRNLSPGGGEFFPAEAYYTLRHRQPIKN